MTTAPTTPTATTIPEKLAKIITTCELLDSEALTSARQWLQSNAWCLILAGGYGVGKSLAAASVAWEQRHRFWLRAGSLNDATWDERSRITSEARRAPFLVVDDLGCESPHNRELLSDLLCERGDVGLRTIATTNVKLSDLSGSMPRFFDRVREGGVDDRGRARWARGLSSPRSLRGVNLRPLYVPPETLGDLTTHERSVYERVASEHGEAEAIAEVERFRCPPASPEKLAELTKLFLSRTRESDRKERQEEEDARARDQAKHERIKQMVIDRQAEIDAEAGED